MYYSNFCSVPVVRYLDLYGAKNYQERKGGGVRSTGSQRSFGYCRSLDWGDVVNASKARKIREGILWGYQAIGLAEIKGNPIEVFLYPHYAYTGSGKKAYERIVNRWYEKEVLRRSNFYKAEQKAKEKMRSEAWSRARLDYVQGGPREDFDRAFEEYVVHREVTVPIERQILDLAIEYHTVRKLRIQSEEMGFTK